MFTRYLFTAFAATFLAACSSATAHNNCDNIATGSGGAGGDSTAGAISADEAFPCLFVGSAKVAECHDAQLGSIPYCGRNAPAPFADCVSPGINIGDDNGPDQGWVWWCCQATHLIDGGP